MCKTFELSAKRADQTAFFGCAVSRAHGNTHTSGPGNLNPITSAPEAGDLRRALHRHLRCGDHHLAPQARRGLGAASDAT